MTDHKQDFERDGFVRLPGFFSEDEVDRLHESIESVARARRKASGLNKEGLLFHSNLFYESSDLQQFAAQRRIIEFLLPIIGPDFFVRWDQAVEKEPGGAEFPWHQDNGYNKLRIQHFQFWVALTRMTKDNGGLWLQPGSHRGGNIPHERVDNHMVARGNPEDAVLMEADRGDAILFSSQMLHRTGPNVTQDESRWAYVLEYMSARDWDPFIDGPYFMVARNGRPTSYFADMYEGQTNPQNYLKYADYPVRSFLNKVRVKASMLMPF